MSCDTLQELNCHNCQSFERPRITQWMKLVLHKFKQRDLMRSLYVNHRRDEGSIISEYAAAEQRGEVGRKNNTNQLSPEKYAKYLLNDGKRKGWINEF